MADPFKLFVYVQKCLKRVGIETPKENQKRLISAKSAFFLLFNIHIFILMVISHITATESIHEYALSFYFTSTSLVVISIYGFSIIHYADIIVLIGKFEQFIEKSKLKCN